MTNECVGACSLHAYTSAGVCAGVPVRACTQQRVCVCLLVCHMMSCGNP